MDNENLPSQEIEDENGKRNTIETAINSGLGDLITQVSAEHNLNTLDEKLGMPVPIELLPISDRQISVSPDVQNLLDALTEIINDPNKKISVEIPFCLMGSDNNLDNAVTLHKDFYKLKSTEVIPDSEKFSNAIYKVINSDTLETFALCHTHPKLSDLDMQDVLTTKISLETKEKFGIKRAGFNLSLQDLYVLQWLHENFGDKTDLVEGVLIPNGNLILIEIKNDRFQLIRSEKS
ncbi:hypothetical protein KKG08_00320 [Patescibacteria group bacterium]|nr:hypothetical protein [Patescibacteria group bacterium]